MTLFVVAKLVNFLSFLISEGYRDIVIGMVMVVEFSAAGFRPQQL